MASAVSIYVVIQTLALVSAYPSEMFGGREAQTHLARQYGELVTPAFPRRYALSAVENKPAQIGQGQQQERDGGGGGASGLDDDNRPGSDLLAQNSANPANKARDATSQSDAQAPAPRDLFIEDCYEIDAEGRGRIDWYGLGSEAEAKTCFKELATKAGSPEAFAEILRSNGMKVYTGEFLQGPVVEGYKFISSYIEAGQYFGYMSYFALTMFHPVALIATWLTGHNWSLRVQVTYEASPEVKPYDVSFRYDITFK